MSYVENGALPTRKTTSGTKMTRSSTSFLLLLLLLPQLHFLRICNLLLIFLLHLCRMKEPPSSRRPFISRSIISSSFNNSSYYSSSIQSITQLLLLLLRRRRRRIPRFLFQHILITREFLRCTCTSSFICSILSTLAPLPPPLLVAPVHFRRRWRRESYCTRRSVSWRPRESISNSSLIRP